MKIYIVEGSTGQWEDSCQWPVKGFKDKNKADELCDRLNEIILAHRGGLRERSARETVNKLLHDAGDPGVSVDYNGADYIVFELEVE